MNQSLKELHLETHDIIMGKDMARHHFGNQRKYEYLSNE